MANPISTSQMFIPFNRHSDAYNSNCENYSHLRNINNVTVFENRVKRRRRDPQCEDSIQNSVPWKKRDRYSSGVIGLHEEVNDFYETMSPATEEKEIRHRVIDQVQQIVYSLWPQAQVDVFGSFKTELYLPSSDIDIVVTGKWDRLPLNTLKSALVKAGIQDSDIFVISNTAVPIVRLVHSLTKVKVDISFNVPNGLKSAELIKEYINKFPTLPKVTLVLKQFLLHRGLNEVYYGGMSSYALTLLVISFLQGHHKPKFLQVTNLGTLLIEFFELYGINFNYDKVSISIQNGGAYFPKNNPWGSYLSISDPLCAENDITKGTFLMREIKKAFENAYNTLHRAVTQINDQTRPESLLQLILDVDENVLIHRQWTKDNYEVFLSSFPRNPRSITYENKDWKENVQESVPSKKDNTVQINTNTKVISDPQPDDKRPLQKTRFFYGSRQSFRTADFGVAIQESSRNNFTMDGRMNNNSNYTDYNRKNYRQGKKGFKCHV